MPLLCITRDDAKFEIAWLRVLIQMTRALISGRLLTSSFILPTHAERRDMHGSEAVM